MAAQALNFSASGAFIILNMKKYKTSIKLAWLLRNRNYSLKIKRDVSKSDLLKSTYCLDKYMRWIEVKNFDKTSIVKLE